VTIGGGEWRAGEHTFSLSDVGDVEIVFFSPPYLWGIFWLALAVLAVSATVVMLVRHAPWAGIVMISLVTIGLVQAGVRDARHRDVVAVVVHMKSRGGFRVTIVVRDEVEASRVHDALLGARDRRITDSS
jgi:hypothetical protein